MSEHAALFRSNQERDGKWFINPQLWERSCNFTKLGKVSDKRLKSSQIKRMPLVSFWSQWVKKVITKQHNVSNSPFLDSSCLFEQVAASMEIIIFLSVSPSCVKASKPPTTRFWGIYRRITHFAACSHTWKDSLVFFNHCVCTPPMHALRVLNSVECSAAGRKPCVCVWVCEVMWHFWADMKRHSAPPCLEEAPGYRHWWRPRVSGERPHDGNKRKQVKLHSPACLLEDALLNNINVNFMVPIRFRVF